MKVVIHRGSTEIGGSCIQIYAGSTTILFDLGHALSRESKDIDVTALQPDAVLISHPHQDHFGLIDQLDPSIPVYISVIGKSTIDAARTFLKKELHTNTFRYFKAWEDFRIGDFKITPYLVDHSAGDAHAFLVEGEGKRIFYSGDFRAHGRKSSLFQHIITNPPQNIDLLFLEGTMLNRSNEDFPTEKSVEDKILETIRKQENISFLITSSQNIDRIVSGFCACKRAGKTLVIDIYTAWVLEQMKRVSTRVPSMEWDQVGLYANYSQDQTLKNSPDFFGDFRKHVYKQRVTKAHLRNAPSDYLYVGRMSLHKIIDQYKAEKQINVVYSQWLGYLKCTNKEYRGAEAFAAYQKDPQIKFVYAHTSGHATVDDLRTFAGALNARRLVPIHTEFSMNYVDHFKNVFFMNDGESYLI